MPIKYKHKAHARWPTLSDTNHTPNVSNQYSNEFTFQPIKTFFCLLDVASAVSNDQVSKHIYLIYIPTLITRIQFLKLYIKESDKLILIEHSESKRIIKSDFVNKTSNKL